MTKEQTQHDREVAEIRQLQRESEARWREHDERMREHDKRMVELRQFIADLGVRFADLGTTVKATEKLNAETAKQLAQLGTTVKAIEKVNAETDKRLAELAKRSEAADKRAAEADKRADKALAVAEKNNQYIGDVSRNNGELLEMECYNALMKTKTVNGIKLDGFQPGPKDPYHGVEIDLIGFNGKVTMPIEVKRTMSPADVRRFAEVRMERFPKAFPYLARGKEVIPVIIFALPRTGVDADGKPEDPVKLALDLGLTVLQSTGENQLSPITAPDQVISRPHETTDLT